MSSLIQRVWKSRAIKACCGSIALFLLLIIPCSAKVRATVATNVFKSGYVDFDSDSDSSQGMIYWMESTTCRNSGKISPDGSKIAYLQYITPAYFCIEEIKGNHSTKYYNRPVLNGKQSGFAVSQEWINNDKVCVFFRLKIYGVYPYIYDLSKDTSYWLVNPCWPVSDLVVWDIGKKKVLYLMDKDVILTDFSSGIPVSKLNSYKLVRADYYRYLFKGDSEIILLGRYFDFTVPSSAFSNPFAPIHERPRLVEKLELIHLGKERPVVYEISPSKSVPYQVGSVLINYNPKKIDGTPLPRTEMLVKLSPDESKLIYPLEVKNKKAVEVHIYSFVSNKDILITTVRFESPLRLNYYFSKSGQKVYVVNNNEYKVNKDKTFKKFIRVYDTTTGKLMNTLEMTFDKNLVIEDVWSDE